MCDGKSVAGALSVSLILLNILVFVKLLSSSSCEIVLRSAKLLKGSYCEIVKATLSNLVIFALIHMNKQRGFEDVANLLLSKLRELRLCLLIRTVILSAKPSFEKPVYPFS